MKARRASEVFDLCILLRFESVRVLRCITLLSLVRRQGHAGFRLCVDDG